MSAPAKFLFNVDFGRAAAAEAETRVPLARHEALLAEKGAASYQAGVAAGKLEAAAETERRAALALESAAAALERMAAGLAGVERRLEAEAVEVAVAVARKLAPELIAREPLAEIEALARDCFAHLVAAPHVVIRLSEAAYAAARDRLEAIARERGFEGRLVLLAEPALADGDCRIEWADGGVVRERAQVEAAIADAVGGYVSARRAGPGHDKAEA